eukprot:m.20694 g.20694  ORF g.20694 m.20694 type:complete len:417 (-) comp3818_c0_seq1:86-1336(-)
MGRIRSTKHVRSVRNDIETGLSARGQRGGASARMSMGTGLVPAPPLPASMDPWAPERAAGGLDSSAPAGMSGALSTAGFLAPPPSLSSGKRFAMPATIPGMSIVTASGKKVAATDAPVAMEFETVNLGDDGAAAGGGSGGSTLTGAGGKAAVAAAASGTRSAVAAAGTVAAVAESDKKPRASTKLERRKQKRDAFLTKLNVLHSSKARHAAIARKKANPHVVVGDVTGLVAELDEIHAAAVPATAALARATAASSAASTTTPSVRRPSGGVMRKAFDAAKSQVAATTKRTTSKKGRRAALLTESAAFKQTLAHPQFRMQPAATIAEHLRNSMRAEKAAVEGLVAAGVELDLPRSSAATSKKITLGESGRNTKGAGGAKGAGQGTRTASFKAKAHQHGKMGKGGRLSKHQRRAGSGK